MSELFGKVIVALDPRYSWPTEVETLPGDLSKTYGKFAWKPRITFEEMVQTDFEQVQRDHLVEREGFKAFKQYH